MVICLFVSLFLTGCGNIDKAQAEAKAYLLITERAKFFTKYENATVDVQQYKIDILNSDIKDNYWLIEANVSAFVVNETKSKLLIVRLDKKSGELIDLSQR